MDREIQMFKYEFEIHKVTQNRLIKLKDEQGQLLLIIPVEKTAVNAVFRSMANHELTPVFKIFMDMMYALEGKIQKVVIDDLQDGRLYATIHYTNYKNEKFVEKAIASDAFTMAFQTESAVFVKESIIKTTKHDTANRVYWYTADDKELLDVIRATSDEDLAELPPDDLKQLLIIATEIEDFEFAARLKKADDIHQINLNKVTEMITEYILEHPAKFLEEFQKRLDQRHISDDESQES
jgi:bifunctional DNase/RNase